VGRRRRPAGRRTWELKHPAEYVCGYSALCALVEQGENTTIEFKSTLRVNLHTGQNDAKMELAILKTIAAFLNVNGGTLVIGVTDDGNPVGIGADKFANEDKMYLHLVNLIKWVSRTVRGAWIRLPLACQGDKNI